MRMTANLQGHADNRKMLMQLHRKHAHAVAPQTTNIYMRMTACECTAKDARPHAVIPQKMHGDAYIYIYIMTACGYTAKDGPLNVCDI